MFLHAREPQHPVSIIPIPLAVAVRICRTAEELGWRTVALYTEKDASHASYADEAVLLDSSARYMDPQYLADVAIR